MHSTWNIFLKTCFLLYRDLSTRAPRNNCNSTRDLYKSALEHVYLSLSSLRVTCLEHVHLINKVIFPIQPSARVRKICGHNLDLHSPLPSGKAALTFSKALMTLPWSATFSDTVFRREEQDFLNSSSPASVRHPANTLHPKPSNLFAARLPKPVSHPVTRT